MLRPISGEFWSHFTKNSAYGSVSNLLLTACTSGPHFQYYSNNVPWNTTYVNKWCKVIDHNKCCFVIPMIDTPTKFMDNRGTKEPPNYCEKRKMVQLDFSIAWLTSKFSSILFVKLIGIPLCNISCHKAHLHSFISITKLDTVLKFESRWKWKFITCWYIINSTDKFTTIWKTVAAVI